MLSVLARSALGNKNSMNFKIGRFGRRWFQHENTLISDLTVEMNVCEQHGLSAAVVYNYCAPPHTIRMARLSYRHLLVPEGWRRDYGLKPAQPELRAFKISSNETT